jgi:hypothetical protein
MDQGLYSSPDCRELEIPGALSGSKVRFARVLIQGAGDFFSVSSPHGDEMALWTV